MHARMRDFIMTGSPRSLRSLAMIKSTIPSSPPLEGCRAAAGWSENARKCYILVIASETKQSSQLCTRECATLLFTGSPRSQCSLEITKSATPSSPPLEGCRAAAGWSENTRTRSHSVPGYAAPHTSVIASETKQSSKLCTRVCATLFAL